MFKRLLMLFFALLIALSLSLPAYAVTEYVAVNDRQIISLAYFTESSIFYNDSSTRFIPVTWSVPYGSSSYTTYGGQASFYVNKKVNMSFDVYLPFGGVVELMIPADFVIDSVAFEDSSGMINTDATLIYFGTGSGSYTIKSGSTSYDVRTYSITCESLCERLILYCSTQNSTTRVVPYAYGGINAFNPSSESNLETILENICTLLENSISVDLAAVKKYTYSISSKIDNIESYTDSCRAAFQKCIDRADYSSALNYAAVVDTIYSTYIDLCDDASDYFQLCIIKDLFDVYLNKAQNDYSKMLSNKYKVSEDDSNVMGSYSELEKAAFDSFSMAQFESLTAYDQYLLKLDPDQASYLKQIYDLIINSEFGQAFVIVPLSFSLMALLLGAPIRSMSSGKVSEAPESSSSTTIEVYDYYDKTLYLGSGDK